MPCKVSWENNELIWEFSGDISTEEFHEINSGPYGDPKWDNLKCLIADFKNVKSLDLPELEVQLIQAMDRAASMSNAHLKIATITNSKSIKKIAEFYGSDSPWECGIFETVEQARSWLGN